MPKKIVEVHKSVVVVYEVDGATADEQAVSIVKARMKEDMPLGILDTQEKVEKFIVRDE